MTRQITEKLQAAERAARELHSDMSGGLENNVEALRDLRSSISMMIEALEQDLVNRDERGGE